jgi:hypothetical protein
MKKPKTKKAAPRVKLTADDQNGPCPKGGKHDLHVYDYIVCGKCGNWW